MKAFYLILFINITFSNTPIFAQNNIAVINTEKLTQTIKEKVYLDSMYSAIKDTLMQIGYREVKKLQKKFAEYQKYSGHYGIQKRQEIGEELQTDQDKLAAFEKYTTDTLNLFKQEALNEINQLINEEVQFYAKEKNLQLVINTKELTYYDKTLDITAVILPRIKARQANHPTWIDKIEALKTKYLVEERLKFEL